MRRFAVALLVVACLWAPGPALAGALFLIKGSGWGNGLGMSQWGAEGYALHGWDYKRILAHFYPHTTLSVAADRPVRVLVAVDQQRVRIGSAAPFVLIDARSHKVHVRAGTVQLGARLRFGGRRLVPPINVEPGAQPLVLGDVGYRGSLTVLRRKDGLSVVNTVSLELYLRGVVPSEMPEGWLLQAYEAQAVAARSYALAGLQSAGPFDLYADSRNQVYAGIAAETAATNDAIGRTAGQVLTYEGTVIRAYYDSDSGGRTAAVEDVFAGSAPRPYLVSVSDPYDSISPYRHWRVPLGLDDISAQFGMQVEDLRLEHGESGIVRRVGLLGPTTSKWLSAAEFSQRLGLRSLRFTVSVLSIDGSARSVHAGAPLRLHGFLRGVGGVVLQQRLPNGSWRQVARVHARSDGRFDVSVRPRFPTAYRLAVDEVGGPPLEVTVSRAAPPSPPRRG
jgi:stage II sporulation protein D